LKFLIEKNTLSAFRQPERDPPHHTHIQRKRQTDRQRKRSNHWYKEKMRNTHSFKECTKWGQLMF